MGVPGRSVETAVRTELPGPKVEAAWAEVEDEAWAEAWAEAASAAAAADKAAIGGQF